METVTCVEITKFVLDPSSSGTLPSSLCSSKVAHDLGLRYGLETQDPQNLYLIRAWDTSRSLHGFTESLTEESNARLDLTIPGKPAYRMHVHLECEPYTALNAPLTEIVVWKMLEGVSRVTVEQLLTRLMDIVDNIPFKEGKYKAGWGHVMNDDSEWQFVVMIGWTDMDAFTAAVRNSPAGRGVLDELAKVTERQIRHTVLTQPQPQIEALQMYDAHL